MAQVQFTDGTGAATLRNNFYGTAASRFANWTPMTRPYGDAVPRMSDHAITMFKLGTDYGATFDLVGIPVKAQTGAVNYVAIADRLIAWLMQGGQCSVQTEDSATNTYATCGLAPGTTPTLRMTNRKTLEYTLSLSLINLAGSPVQMVAVYA
jgi:hypothetical protein